MIQKNSTIIYNHVDNIADFDENYSIAEVNINR